MEIISWQIDKAINMKIITYKIWDVFSTEYSIAAYHPFDSEFRFTWVVGRNFNTFKK